MAYEMVMPYHLHMPSYFLETFTEYPDLETSEVLYSALLNPKNADFKCKGSGLVWIIIILVL